MPGAAAVQALVIARDNFPGLNTQALVDKLVICGVSALLHEHWKPPWLHGGRRDRWKLPDELSPEECP